MRSMPPAEAAGAGADGSSMAFDNIEATCLPPRQAWRTCSTASKSNPGRPSIVPRTRSTFQAGRASPRGCTVAWKLCTRPSVLMNVPGVSVNGAIGSSTSPSSDLKALRLTVKRAPRTAAIAACGLAQSNCGSTLSSSSACFWSAAGRPPPAGRPATWPPTELAASPRKPSLTPVSFASACAAAWSCAACG